MEIWKNIYDKSVVSAKQLAVLFKQDQEEIQKIIDRYPMRINYYYLNLIKSKNDPIWKQCVPNIKELSEKDGKPDPLREEKYSPLFGLVHRYPDRVLLLVSNMCASYCRFCTRKRKVGKVYKSLRDKDFKKAINYIKSHKKVRDVILSGGDPLLLEDKKIEKYLSALKKIKHVEIIRIDSRTPCALPQRITESLCRMLKKYQPIYFLTHFNHPREITLEAKTACNLLADYGIVLGNQSVLLKGVNDNPKVLTELGEKLLQIRVRPYYIYIPDAVLGTYHFRVSIEKALKIMKKVIGHTSGLAVPRLILDLAKGGGKTPLHPDYIQSKVRNKYIFSNFEGRHFTYYDVK